MTVLPLIAANLIPLLGVLFWGWDLLAILIAFWAETAIIGFFTVVKILTANGKSPTGETVPWALRLFLAPFFCLHFGLFMAVHGVFVVLAGMGSLPKDQILDAAPRYALDEPQILYFLLGATASHGWSTLRHHFLAGERHKHGPQYFMMQPYGRVVVMHMAILFGAFGTIVLGSSTVVLVILVALKTALDWRAHKKEHQESLGQTPAPAG